MTAKASTPANASSRAWLRIAAVFGVVALIGGSIHGLHWFNADPLPTPVPTSQRSGDSVRVSLDQMHQLEVVKTDLYPFRTQRAAIGQIAFNEDTSTVVLAPYSGRVVRLIAKIGQDVRSGDPLVELDCPDVLQPQNDFIAALATLNKARTQFDLAKIGETRQRSLYEGKAGPLRELQQAEAQRVDAENDLRTAETALEAARARLRIMGRSEEEIEALQQKGAISRAFIIRAPIDGTVVARKVGPGQFVRSDTGDALYTIADLSSMWLRAYVFENEIPFVRVDQDIEVTTSALPNRVLTARITAIGAAADANTRRVVVRSEIPNPDRLLKSEMFASFRIATGDAQTNPGVPVEAVIREGALATVWVEEQEMIYRRRTVTIGREQDGRVEIREGLKPGERVVTRGAIFIDNEWRQ
jgi:cobalt-zinc-cadmium efflux system membrane fusion protein